MVSTAFNFLGKEFVSARMKITVIMIKKLLLNTEPSPVIVVPAMFKIVVGEKFPIALVRSNSRFRLAIRGLTELTSSC